MKKLLIAGEGVKALELKKGKKGLYLNRLNNFQFGQKKKNLFFIFSLLYDIFHIYKDNFYKKTAT